MSDTAVLGELRCNVWGQLEWLAADGTLSVGVHAVRAFPIRAPLEGVALVSADGHELQWFDQLDQAPPAMRELIEQALTQREFMPEIRSLQSVSSFVTPSTWQIETDRGPTALLLKGEEDIRRLSANTLLVSDAHGVQFLIRDLHQMDRHTRRLLDRFL